MKRAFLVTFMLLIAIARPAASQPQGPRELVTAYMQALQDGDYGTSLQLAGVELPSEAMVGLNQLLKRQTTFQLVVKRFTIGSVKQDGGLAVVEVEEVVFKDASAFLRSRLRSIGFDDLVKWGEQKVRERFVLVRLDGKWQFDASHSGVQMAAFPAKELAESAKHGGMPSREVLQKLGAFIDGIGVGQLVQSMSAAGPVVPALAAVVLPSFERARTQGTLTGCKSNLKNMGTALEMYSTDYAGRFPVSLSSLTPDYLRMIPTCPAARSDTYSAGFQSASNPDAFTVYCGGSNHGSAGIPADFPQYSSTQGVLDR